MALAIGDYNSSGLNRSVFFICCQDESPKQLSISTLSGWIKMFTLCHYDPALDESATKNVHLFSFAWIRTKQINWM